jgi:cytochrome P450
MSQALDIGINPADVARNRMVGAGLVNDPYPVYDRLRASGPVHRGTIAEAFGVEGPDLANSPFRERPQFACYDFETADAVLRDASTWSSRWYEPTLGPFVGESILQMDEPEHRRYRALIQPAFTLREMERWRERWIEPAAHALIDELASRGRADLYMEVCARLPVQTIARSFGIPVEQVPHFHELAVAMVGVTNAAEARMRAAQEIAAFLEGVIEERRARPQDDLIRWLLEAEVVGEDGQRQKLDHAGLLAFARLLLPAGAGTTYRALGALLFALLRDREQLEAVYADRKLLGPAIEESLRWEQPLAAVSRLATRDTELAGMPMPAGSVMHACLAAANHDPARWTDPHRFDLFRPARPHLSFGSGPHLCVGMHLARMELRVAMNAILDRLKHLRLDPDAEPPFMTGLLFRMPSAVPVRFDS